MKQICWICKRTEEDFLKQKEELLEQIEKEIREHNDFEKNIVAETSLKLGFTNGNKDRVQKIKCLDVTLSAILDNEKYFLDTDPDIQILLDYYKTYISKGIKKIDGEGVRVKTVQSISNANPEILKDVADLYCNEPIEIRYQEKLNKNKRERDSLIDRLEKIKSIKTSFTLQKVEPKFYSFPENVCYERQRGVYDMSDRPHPDISYSSLGFKFEEEVSLCSICSTLFLQAANAVFETQVAQIRANEQQELYDDWDDDDDF